MNHLDTIKNQTILLQTSNHPTPHLETELEIMERLLQQGNTIYLCFDAQYSFNII